jgi:putative dehydrogenase
MKIKLVNNLLAGVHLCAAAEAFAFAQKKGMDLKTVYDVVSKGAAWSYMMVDREVLHPSARVALIHPGAPRIFATQPPVHSALDTLAKDLGLVLAEAKLTYCPLFLGAAAQQQFVRASAMGYGQEDDSAVSKLWEVMGIKIASD